MGASGAGCRVCESMGDPHECGASHRAEHGGHKLYEVEAQLVE
jgi:hypothetical protein